MKKAVVVLAGFLLVFSLAMPAAAHFQMIYTPKWP